MLNLKVKRADLGQLKQMIAEGEASVGLEVSGNISGVDADGVVHEIGLSLGDETPAAQE